MADEIVKEDDSDSHKNMITNTNDQESSKNVSSLKMAKLLTAKNSESHSLNKSQSGNVHVTSELHKTDNDKPVLVSDSPEDKIVVDKSAVMAAHPRKSRSSCRPRSRDPRKCQMNFREMIGKHETRNEELEQLECDLRERLDMLECSMPAVMVWNIMRMAQGAPPSEVRRLMEKQFQGVQAAGNVSIPCTPSQHYDCRVREIEAERKEALRRAEEARALLTDKEAAVEDRRKRLEEAKKCNQERKERIERLNREAAELREAMKNARGDDRSCETGECGEIRCKEKFLGDVGSLSSIGSTDLECFAKLQDLAESELCMKRQITELERREEAYMRTLQQADELWSKMEGDSFGSVRELQEQLDLKNAANQQLADRICQLEDELEKLKKRLIGCNDELGKFTSKTYADAEIGFKNGVASVADHGIIASVTTVTSFASAYPETVDIDSTVHPETMDKESMFVPESDEKGVNASTKMSDKQIEAIVDQMEREVDGPIGLGIDAGVGDNPVDGIDASESEIDSLRKPKYSGPNEKEPENEDEIPEKWKNWNWDEGCPPDTICNDMVESSTNTNDLQPSPGVPTTESKVQATVIMVEQPVGGREAEDMAEIIREVEISSNNNIAKDTDSPSITKAPAGERINAETTQDTNQIILSREELRNWYNIVNSIHHTMSQCINCKSKLDATAQLMGKMNSHLWIMAIADSKNSVIDEETAKTFTNMAEIRTENLRELDTEPIEYRSSTPLISIAATKPDVDTYTSNVSEIIDEGISDVLKNNMMHSTENTETMDISIVKITSLTEATSATAKSSDISDKFPEILKPKNDTTEEQTDADEEILPGVSPQVFSQNEIKEIVEPLAAEADNNEENPLVSSPRAEEGLPGLLAEQQLPEQLSDINIRISKAYDAFSERVSDIEKDAANIPKNETISQLPESPEGSKQYNPVSQEDDVNFVKSVDTLEKKETIEMDVADIPKDKTISQVSDSPEASKKSISISQKGDSDSEKSVDTLEKLFEILAVAVEIEQQPGTQESASPLLDKRDISSALRPSFELQIVHAETEVSLSNEYGFQDVIERILEEVVQTQPSPRVEKFEAPTMPITKGAEYKEPSVTIFSESEQFESTVPSAAKEEETMKSKINCEVTEVSPSDEVLLEESLEKRTEKTPEKETQDKSRLSIAKAESKEKLQQPESVDTCICTAAICRPVITIVRELDTEGTQTSPQMPRTLDRIKLKTIAESTWRSPDEVRSRRPLIWSRRRKDKSTLTTVCVDTQTDSALVRDRITQRGIDRKDDCTCSGVVPRKTKFGGSYGRVSTRHTDERLPSPVSRAVAKPFDSPTLRSSTASTEKKISVMKYTDKSLPSEGSEPQCVDCGKPITPEDTSLSLKTSLRTSTKSQKSLMQTLKEIATSSTLRMARKKDDIMGCEYKMLDKTKTENTSGIESEFEKSFNGKICDKELCCPCPSGVTEKIATQLSKSDRKRRKPEKKDQSVTANIPRRKLKKRPKENKEFDDTDSTAIVENKNSVLSNERGVLSKKGSKIITSSSKNVSKIISSSSKTVSNIISSSPKSVSRHSGSSLNNSSDVKSSTGKSRSKEYGSVKKLVTKVSSANESTECGCSKNSTVLVPYTNYSSIFRANITKDETACNCGDNKLTKNGNVSACDCSSIESVSKQESSCNCAEL